MKKFFTVLLLCAISAPAVGMDDDCLTSPYNNKTYCCNVREKNLPNDAINKSWGEVIPWNRYYGTIRKCVGGQMTNDHFTDPFDGVDPNLYEPKIRPEAAEYRIAWYTKFDGTHWSVPKCYGDAWGSYVAYSLTTGGCEFSGLLDVEGTFYKCGSFDDFPNAVDYINKVTGKLVYFAKEGDYIRRSPNSFGAYAVYGCLGTSEWEGTPFCKDSDMPTNTEIQSGVMNNLDAFGWTLDEAHICWMKRTMSKYNYKTCSTNADCVGIDNKKTPYLHSTAWQCATQIADVKVCAATDCEPGYHIALDENNKSKGFCEQDAVDDEEVIEEEAEVIEEEEIEDPFEDPSGGDPEPPKRTKSVTINCNSIPETIPQNGRCVCRDKNKKIQGNKCEYTAEYFASITADIEKKYKNLTTLVAGFGKSEWRDKDGNFNTARLASDSVAGVVLGTVGGVVTAHLVKKAQVKQGFEDMKCSVGGQPVASYGDSFIVGR